MVKRALEKDQIDEIIRRSEGYRQPSSFQHRPSYTQMLTGKTTEIQSYRYEDNFLPPPQPGGENAHYEALRTEWINPPSIRGAPSVRAPSPARSSRTIRAHSAVRPPEPAPAPPIQQIIIEDRRRSPPAIIQAPAPPQIIQTMPAPPLQPAQPMTVVVPERYERSDRDIHAEIRRLESEARSLQRERESDRRELFLRRPEEEYGVVEYRPRREIEVVEREPKRDTLRVEKDRKGRMALVRSAH